MYFKVISISFPGCLPWLGCGAGRGSGIGSSLDPRTPKILGVLNYHMLNRTFKMAVSSSEPKFLSVLRRVRFSLNNGNVPSGLNLKPLQMKCFEDMLRGQDVIGVLLAGFGKSMLFHHLPQFIPVKTTKNIVVVVCPFNSLIEEQLKVLKAPRITAHVQGKGPGNEVEAFSANWREHSIGFAKFWYNTG